MLSDGGDNPLAEEVLGLLDRTRVIVRSGPSTCGGHRVALAALVGIVARLFAHITVEPVVQLPPNWWGAADTTDLLTGLSPVRPVTSTEAVADIVIGFGYDIEPGDLHVGGGDWTVRVGTDPQTLDSNATHALGVHAAACLIISQLLLEVLEPVGFPGVRMIDPVVTNLIDYCLTPEPDDLIPDPGTPWETPLSVVLAGVGSVGSSAAALLAGAVGPAFRSPRSGNERPLQIVTIDSDHFDPNRNPFRYPALSGNESDNKATNIADRLTNAGIPATSAPVAVATWNVQRERPALDGLLVSSVDTIPGRLDVADVLAHRNLSIGVSGMALHAQREGFADGFACPFCDFVRADPPMTQAGVFAQVTGLEVTRVLALLQGGAVLTAHDVDGAVAAGRVPLGRREALIGAPLSDLVRQAYAEAEVRGTQNRPEEQAVVAVASPQVSWFAGVLVAAEIVKEARGLPVLDRRVDFDVSGIPPGLVRRIPADATGTCLCRSGTRIRWHREMYAQHVGHHGGIT